MIDAIVKVTEKLVQLLERREKERRNLFFDHIEPMYNDMASIHSHYLSEFTNLLLECCENTHPSTYFVNKLQNRKTEMESVRAKVYAIAKHRAYNSKNKLPTDVANFMEASLRYFRITSGEVRGYAGHYTDLIMLLDNKLSGDTNVTKPLGDHHLKIVKSPGMLSRYRLMPLELGEQELIYIQTTDDGHGNITEKRTSVSALRNIGTLEQNLDITISYIRFSWDEITEAYAACRDSLL